MGRYCGAYHQLSGEPCSVVSHKGLTSAAARSPVVYWPQPGAIGGASLAAAVEAPHSLTPRGATPESAFAAGIWWLLSRKCELVLVGNELTFAGGQLRCARSQLRFLGCELTSGGSDLTFAGCQLRSGRSQLRFIRTQLPLCQAVENPVHRSFR